MVKGAEDESWEEDDNKRNCIRDFNPTSSATHMTKFPMTNPELHM